MAVGEPDYLLSRRPLPRCCTQAAALAREIANTDSGSRIQPWLSGPAATPTIGALSRWHQDDLYFVIKDNLHDDQIFLQGVDCGESQQASHSKDAFQVQLIIMGSLILVVIVITMIIINSRIASVSKSVTAMAVMALVDRGLLDLDSKVII